MSVVCWTDETNPVLELDAYKRAFEDDWGHRVFTLERFELRCSREFMEWMMDLPSMKPLVAMLIQEAQRSMTYVSPWRRFYLNDNVLVTSRDDVDAAEAKLVAVMQSDFVEVLLSITAVGLVAEPSPPAATERPVTEIERLIDAAVEQAGLIHGQDDGSPFGPDIGFAREIIAHIEGSGYAIVKAKP